METLYTYINNIKKASRIFVQGGAATPHYLLKLLSQNNTIEDVEIVAISTQGDLPIRKQISEGKIFVNSLFVSNNVREIVNNGHGSAIPVFLSEIPDLFNLNILPLDYAFIHLSPPDKHGYCSLGVSVDVARAAMLNAKVVLAQINKKMPRTHGDGLVHIRELDAYVEVDEDLPEVLFTSDQVDEVNKVGNYCAELVEDGATLQMGIGAIPDAVLNRLGNHQKLGIHTEMFSDGVIDLVKKGVITNEMKKKHPGKMVTGFALGSRKLYDFVDDNPFIHFLEVDYVNDPGVIRRNPKVTAINSAIALDITGQACSDSIGTKIYSGFGGQVDFMRGAALSKGGKPIIALTSTTSKGVSKICPELMLGSGVVTTRAHIHYVVTEYGYTNLFGKNYYQRAKALINLAHPNHRESLEKAAFERFGSNFWSFYTG